MAYDELFVNLNFSGWCFSRTAIYMNIFEIRCFFTLFDGENVEKKNNEINHFNEMKLYCFLAISFGFEIRQRLFIASSLTINQQCSRKIDCYSLYFTIFI